MQPAFDFGDVLPADPGADNVVERVLVLRAGDRRRKARVVEEVATFHEHREAPEQRLVGRRDVDVLAVARLVEVVRRMARQPRSRALRTGAEPFRGRTTWSGEA